MLSRFHRYFLPWASTLKSQLAITIRSDFMPKKTKSALIVSILFPICRHKYVIHAMISFFDCWVFKPDFFTQFSSCQEASVFSLFSATEWQTSAHSRLLYFLRLSWFQFVLNPVVRLHYMKFYPHVLNLDEYLCTFEVQEPSSGESVSIHCPVLHSPCWKKM